MRLILFLSNMNINGIYNEMAIMKGIFNSM